MPVAVIAVRPKDHVATNGDEGFMPVSFSSHTGGGPAKRANRYAGKWDSSEG